MSKAKVKKASPSGKSTGFGSLKFKGLFIVFLIIIALFLYDYGDGVDITSLWQGWSISQPEKEEASASATLDDSKEQPRKVGDTFKECEFCPEMVVVPAGGFMMGSPEGEEGRDADEGPRYEVIISRQFAVSKYELMQGQFRAFVDSTGYDASNEWSNPGFPQTDEHPVVGVSWDDAISYVRWLSMNTGESYRLLTEAEWEYAARAGTNTAYHFGGTISPDLAHYNYDDSRAPEDGGTVKVGSYSANGFGLHDVHGNVWEWVEDCWHNGYHGAPTDGSAWVSDCDEDKRVLRGGSWYNRSQRNLRSANRYLLSSWDRYGNGGFRVARTLSF